MFTGEIASTCFVLTAEDFLRVSNQILYSNMASSTLSLLDLPPELILEIADHLSPDAILALKFSHRILNYSLPLASRFRNRTLSRCARLAVLSYLSKPTPNPTHLRCVLCKAIYPLQSFQSSSSPACAPWSPAAGVEQTEVVELPQRLCAWHVGRLARIVHTEPGGRNQWVSSSEEMCMHCGAIQSWAKCDCTCDSCSVRAVTAYTRYLNNKTECKKFVFCRKAVSNSVLSPHGTRSTDLFVRETCSTSGESHDTIKSSQSSNVMADCEDAHPVIHVPVQRSDKGVPHIAGETPTCTVASRPRSTRSGHFLSARPQCS